jgi:hypothetical protein
MASKIVSFDPSAMQGEINTASAKAEAARGKISNQSSAWEVTGVAQASQAMVKATAASSVVSNAITHENAANANAASSLSKANAASAAQTVLAASAILSVPGVDSYVVKEFVYTSSSAILARISGNARAV